VKAAGARLEVVQERKGTSEKTDHYLQIGYKEEERIAVLERSRVFGQSSFFFFRNGGYQDMFDKNNPVARQKFVMQEKEGPLGGTCDSGHDGITYTSCKQLKTGGEPQTVGVRP
jgi:hypothetical protein